MLAYAAGRQRIAQRRSSPSTMLFIIGLHVAAVALAMSAKFVIEHVRDTPITIIDIPLPTEPPPPQPPRPSAEAPAPQSAPIAPPTIVPTPPMPGPDMTSTVEPSPPSGPIAGNDPPSVPVPLPPRVVDPVRQGPRLATPAWALRPPYPSSKLDSEEEAALRLRLSIDERGRVVAVDPVGAADPAFLNAARRHLLAKWRYQPATVDGQPIASSTVITLRFELES